MNKVVFDHDPLTGLTTYFDFDQHNQQAVLTYSQDVEPALRKAEALRQDPEYAKKGIKGDWWHYAIVPVGIQYEWLLKHGVNYWNPEHDSKIFNLLNTDYKRFRVSDMIHNIKAGK